MDLITLKDLKQKTRALTRQELAAFENRMSSGAGSADLFDVFLIHSGLPVSLLSTIETLFREKGFSFLTTVGKTIPSGGFTYFRKNIFPRCQSLVIADVNERKYTWRTFYQIGYFACLKNRIAVLPILNKDINTDTYQGKGLFAEYPYLGTGMVFMENREMLWVLKNPKSFVDFEYWLSRDPDYIEW